jgi:L-lactate dehydrogenase
MKKVTIIGAGNVGAHIVSAGIARNLPVEFYLVDRNEEFEAAQVLDLKDALLFSPQSKVFAADFGDKNVLDSDVFIITAGASQKPGETRCELLGRNVKILQSICDALGEIKDSTVIVLVTNPVDILTQLVAEIFKLPAGQILGTGTLLDSARLRWRLAEKLEKNIEDVSGYILGEHGDSEFVAWSSVNSRDNFDENQQAELQEKTKKEAYKIIEGKGSTYFGIGAATAELLSHIIFDTNKILPVSVPLTGQYGISGISVGVPAKIGVGGVKEVVELELSVDEREKLAKSAKKLKELFEGCERRI